MNIIEPKKLKKDISERLGITIPELGTYISQNISNEEELYAFISEVMPEVAEDGKIEEKTDIIKKCFFGEVSYKWYTESEIQEIKSEILETGESTKLLKGSSILPFLKPEELTNENIKKIFSQETKECQISQKGIEIIKRNATQNRLLAETLNIEMLNEEILDAIGEENIGRIIKYPETQDKILEALKGEKQREVFKKAFGEIKETSSYLQPEIEKLCIKMQQIQQENPEFFTAASELINNQQGATEYTQSELLYLLSNPEEAIQLQTANEIADYEENTNKRLEEQINGATSIENLKQLITQRMYRMTSEQASELIRKYGENIQELYGIEQDDENKKYIQELINLKELQALEDEKDIRNLYEKIRQPNKDSVFKKNIWLERKIKDSYSKDIVNDLQNQQEQKEEIIEENEAEGYNIKKISGEYRKMITVIDAFGDRTVAEDFGREKWANPEYNYNHGRCYSLFSNTNPGVHKSGYGEKAIIAVVKKVTPDSITAASNTDIGSSSSNNITNIIKGKDRFLLGRNYPERIRSGYSEFVIESEINGENIEIESFLCLDQVNEETIRAAKDMSARYHRVIDIEVIDTNELAKQHSEAIKENFEAFMQDGNAEQVIEGIKQFLNDTSAFGNTPKSSEWIEEETGIFNYTVINQYLRAAMSKLEANPKDMQAVRNYVQKEKETSSLITGVIETKIIDEIEEKGKTSSKIEEIERLGLDDVRMGEIEESYDIIRDTLQEKSTERTQENPTKEDSRGE